MYVPTTVVVAVVVDGFSLENFSLSPPYAVMAGIGPVWAFGTTACALRIASEHSFTDLGGMDS